MRRFQFSEIQGSSVRATASVAVVALVATLFVASSASGATLVIENGQLMGAQNVLVSGLSYDVSFVAGTCADLYGNCDEESDFTFSWTDPATALAARAALLDQVFVGVYDTEPQLTNGCSADAWCSVNFPIQKLGSPDGIGIAVTTNDEDEPQDNATGSGGGNRLHDTSLVPYQTYAVWSGPLAPPAVPISPWVAIGVLAGGATLVRRNFAA